MMIIPYDSLICIIIRHLVYFNFTIQNYLIYDTLSFNVRASKIFTYLHLFRPSTH